MSNPYNRDSIIGRAYDALKEAGVPVSVTSLAGLIGATYNALYNAIHKDSVKAIELKTDNGVRCAALVSRWLSIDSEEAIFENMQGAEPMRIADIAVESGVSEAAAKAFIAEQNKLGNISITPARSPKDYKYEWVGQVKEPDIPIVAIDNKKEPEQSEYIQGFGFGCLIKPGVVETALVKTDQPIAFYKPETPKTEGGAQMGKEKTKQPAYMVVVNGETSLHISKKKADELAAQQAKSEASVFIYEIVSVNQVIYKPAIVAHDLASLCS